METSNLQLDSNIKSQVQNLDKFASNDKQTELENEICECSILIQKNVFQNQCFMVMTKEIVNKCESNSSSIWLEYNSTHCSNKRWVNW